MFQTNTPHIKAILRTTAKESGSNSHFSAPLVIKVTKMYKGTPNQVTFQPTNTISHLTKERNHTQKNPSAVYNLTCRTCGRSYIGQTGRNFNTRNKEHCRYIKTSNRKSAYALHILKNQHEYGPLPTTMKLIKYCIKK